MSCGVGCRCDLDPILLWLRRRPVAVAPIRPLAWEPPNDTGVALGKKKKKTKICGRIYVRLKRSHSRKYLERQWGS